MQKDSAYIRGYMPIPHCMIMLVYEITEICIILGTIQFCPTWISGLFLQDKSLVDILFIWILGVLLVNSRIPMDFPQISYVNYIGNLSKIKDFKKIRLLVFKWIDLIAQEELVDQTVIGI